jgi:di/tricarboxylate transporter
MQQRGLAPLGMFELTPVGLTVLVIGLVYMGIYGYRLIPDRTHLTEEKSLFDTDLYFTELVIPPGSPTVGKSIEESVLMGELQFGILQLQRGRAQLKPLAETVLAAGDILLVEGTRTNMLRLPQIAEVEVNGKIQELEAFSKNGAARIAEVVLLPGSSLVGRTIRGLGLRERFQIQILAVRHAGAVRHNRIGRFVLNLGDVLLVKIPHQNLRLMEQERYFRVLDIIETPTQDIKRALLASAIFVAALLIGILGILPIAVAVLVGVLLVFLTGCITPQVAYRNIEWKTIILVGSMLAFGKAMEQTGTAAFLADLITHLPITGSPVALLGLFFLLAMVLTQPMSNQAAAAVLVPIALQTATLLNYDPRPFAITIALAASTSFITPLEPASLIVYNAGRYRFIDFIRVGGILTLIVFGVVIVLVPLIWHL